MGVVGQVLFQHYTHIMKLIAISALAAFAAAEQMLAGMHADSDECAGCEVAPEPVFKCFGEACSDVECGNMAAIPDEEGNPTASVECALPEGYYADANNCRGYCFYSGGCSGFHEALAEGA